MAYSHSWELKSDFTAEFLEDVKVIIKEYSDILTDIKVNKERIFFNGIDHYGYETFVLRPHFSNWCKTDYREYDEPICCILLLCAYHFNEKFKLASSGLHVDPGYDFTKSLRGYWTSAQSILESKFGYTFTIKVPITEEELEKFDYSIVFIPHYDTNNKTNNLIPLKRGQLIDNKMWDKYTSNEHRWELWDGIPFSPDGKERDQLALCLIYSMGLKRLLKLLPEKSKEELAKLLNSENRLNE